MNNTKDHQRLVNEILLAIGSRPNIRCWPRCVGVGRAISNPKRVISFGLVGESDIDGIIAPSGRRLSIEVKTGKGKLSEKQQRFREMIERFGGVYIEARSLNQVLTELKQFL